MNPAELFTQGTALAIAVGAVIGLGLALVIGGLVGWPTRPKDAEASLRVEALRKTGQRGLISLGIGLWSAWRASGRYSASAR